MNKHADLMREASEAVQRRLSPYGRDLIGRLEAAANEIEAAAAVTAPVTEAECVKCGNNLKTNEGPQVCRWCADGLIESRRLIAALAAAKGEGHGQN